MSIGRESYKFGSKNNWRRRVWNEACKRLISQNKKLSECKILYLPGPEDIDGKIAIEKGFKPWNLFCIERENDIINKLRYNHVNVIHGDINQVLSYWDIDDSIDFCFADFMCGIHNTSYRFLQNLLTTDALSKESVIAVNLLRGRDIKLDGNYSIHRGDRFFVLLLEYYYQKIFSKSIYDNLNADKNFVLHVNNYINPLFLSYRTESKNTFMDSVIFNWDLCTPLNQRSRIKKEKIKEWEHNSSEDPLIRDAYNFLIETEQHYLERQLPIRNKLISAKAINTMRRNGQLGGFAI